MVKKTKNTKRRTNDDTQEEEESIQQLRHVNYCLIDLDITYTYVYENTNNLLLVCQSALDAAYHWDSWLFRQYILVVEELKLFKEQISNPLDFSIIRHRILNQQYTSASECMSDIAIMISNYYLFFEEDEEMLHYCKVIEHLFFDKLVNIFLTETRTLVKFKAPQWEREKKKEMKKLEKKLENDSAPQKPPELPKTIEYGVIVNGKVEKIYKDPLSLLKDVHIPDEDVDILSKSDDKSNLNDGINANNQDVNQIPCCDTEDTSNENSMSKSVKAIVQIFEGLNAINKDLPDKITSKQCVNNSTSTDVLTNNNTDQLKVTTEAGNQTDISLRRYHDTVELYCDIPDTIKDIYYKK